MLKINKIYKNTLVNDLPIDLKDDIEAAVHKALEFNESEPLVFQSEKNAALDGRVCDLEKLIKITYVSNSKKLEDLIAQADAVSSGPIDVPVAETKREGYER